MSRMASSTVAFVLALAVSFTVLSCTRTNGAEATAPEARPNDRAAEAPPDPARLSYGRDLADASLSLVGRVRPERPFPDTAIVTKAALDLVYGDYDARYVFRAYGGAESMAGESALRFAFSAPREARRGTSVFRIEGRALVLSSESEDGASSPVPLRRWDAGRRLVAGPAVFQDRILLATDAPSFVVIDRATFSPVFERPMESLAVGPLIMLEEPQLIAAFHADGSVGFYSLAQSADSPAPPVPLDGGGIDSPDPVALLIDPSPEALVAMETKTASLMGKEAVRFPPVRLYGPRRAVTGQDVSFFRLDVENKVAVMMRLYLDGAGALPYLVAVYDAAGELLKSNIDYMGAEKVLEFNFQVGATYYFAVAFLSGAEAVAGEAAPVPMAARFVVVPKK